MQKELSDSGKTKKADLILQLKPSFTSKITGDLSQLIKENWKENEIGKTLEKVFLFATQFFHLDVFGI